ncbi:hypothetical protein, partial [Photobacterium marinum]|uniref:hypothetical protein n=1 Tax=Photobacterium marinum TaxID=1056511 RepID=UPI001E310840
VERLGLFYVWTFLMFVLRMNESRRSAGLAAPLLIKPPLSARTDRNAEDFALITLHSFSFFVSLIFIIAY